MSVDHLLLTSLLIELKLSLIKYREHLMKAKIKYLNKQTTSKTKKSSRLIKFFGWGNKKQPDVTSERLHVTTTTTTENFDGIK